MHTAATQNKACDIHLGRDIRFDAWLYSLLMDNNLAHAMNPDIIASAEQLAFMVCLEADQVYLPCSDNIYDLICKGSPELQRHYNRAWRIIIRLIRTLLQDRTERQRIIHFCRLRYLQSINQRTVIPSRLVKRMTSLVLAESYCDDPWVLRRRGASLRQQQLLQLPAIRKYLDVVPSHVSQSLSSGIQHIFGELNKAQFIRLLYLGCMAQAWEICDPDDAEISLGMQQAESAANGLDTYLHDFANTPKTILFVCDADGGTYFDLFLIQKLLGMGHKVIYAVKDGFHFYAPTIDDMLNDAALEDFVRGAHILPDKNISKNDLLKLLREYRFVIVNDGTRERLNLNRVSITFSRAWKEADLILCKGWRTADMFLDSSHQFTRDILCYWHKDNVFHLALRNHASNIHKFSEADIKAQAEIIIKQMRQARKEGRSVVFYSCIIGSIPGQTSMAITIAKIFVNNLRQKTDNVFIINPAEHFVEGMDGDDLMFMWEQVQRSGYINTWHFQTAQDIAESFALLGRKVPPAWLGKDATFSTGCTKEMHIALDVQSKNKEMQIIGPDPRLFSRRGEYGVGKYFDANLTGV